MQDTSFLEFRVNTLEAALRGMISGYKPNIDVLPIPILPKAPSRLSGAATFNIDYPVFLDALSEFVTLLNLNLDALEQFKINMWTMGYVDSVSSGLNITPYTGNPTAQQKPSVQYISAIDNEYKYLQEYSVFIVAFVEWLNELKEERGVVNTSQTFNFLALERPVTRNMQETEFNSRSISFSQSLRDHTKSVVGEFNKIKTNYSGTRKLGRISDTVTKTISCGSITDTELKN